MGLKSRNKVSVAFSMASMTDIVFLLLIFFIIVSTLVSPYALNVTLPTSANKSTEKASVSVTVTPDLIHYLNGKQVDTEGIESIIVSQLAGTEKPQIVLHVDETVPTGITVNILDIANRNKFGIVLATKPK
ncbi:MAG: biopolymer transporter ExbD [Bacteroidetes bacterium]|nr:biopolymer transporter ExbD [Bacteroidota bacterium]HET6245991.1 biopolymer transporter ExbD [Bacteroidia bacterium]